MASGDQGIYLVFLLRQARCTGAAGSHHPTKEQEEGRTYGQIGCRGCKRPVRLGQLRRSVR